MRPVTNPYCRESIKVLMDRYPGYGIDRNALLQMALVIAGSQIQPRSVFLHGLRGLSYQGLAETVAKIPQLLREETGDIDLLGPNQEHGELNRTTVELTAALRSTVDPAFVEVPSLLLVRCTSAKEQRARGITRLAEAVEQQAWESIKGLFRTNGGQPIRDESLAAAIVAVGAHWSDGGVRCAEDLGNLRNDILKDARVERRRRSAEAERTKAFSILSAAGLRIAVVVRDCEKFGRVDLDEQGRLLRLMEDVAYVLCTTIDPQSLLEGDGVGESYLLDMSEPVWDSPMVDSEAREYLSLPLGASGDLESGFSNEEVSALLGAGGGLRDLVRILAHELYSTKAIGRATTSNADYLFGVRAAEPLLAKWWTSLEPQDRELLASLAMDASLPRAYPASSRLERLSRLGLVATGAAAGIAPTLLTYYVKSIESEPEVSSREHALLALLEERGSSGASANELMRYLFASSPAASLQNLYVVASRLRRKLREDERAGLRLVYSRAERRYRLAGKQGGAEPHPAGRAVSPGAGAVAGAGSRQS
jgi:hypothetical protein